MTRAPAHRRRRLRDRHQSLHLFRATRLRGRCGLQRPRGAAPLQRRALRSRPARHRPARARRPQLPAAAAQRAARRHAGAGALGAQRPVRQARRLRARRRRLRHQAVRAGRGRGARSRAAQPRRRRCSRRPGAPSRRPRASIPRESEARVAGVPVALDAEGGAVARAADAPARPAGAAQRDRAGALARTSSPNADALRSQVHWLRKALADARLRRHRDRRTASASASSSGAASDDRGAAGTSLHARRSASSGRSPRRWRSSSGCSRLLAYFALHAQEDDLTDDMLQPRSAAAHHATPCKPGLMPAGSLIASTRV